MTATATREPRPAAAAPRATAGRPEGPRASTVPLVVVEVALAAALAATVVGFERLFTGSDWAPALVANAVLAHLAAALCRRRGWGIALSGVVCLAAAALVLTWFHLGHTTVVGLPTGETWSTLQDHLREAWRAFPDLAPPTAPFTGFVIASGAALWVAAFLADTAAFRLVASFEALLPSGAVFVFVAVMARDDSWSVPAIVFLVAALSFALVHRLHHQTYPVVGPSSDTSDPRLRMGAMLVLGAVLLGAVAAPVIPGSDNDLFDDDEGTRRITTSPLVDVAERLDGPLSPQEMFTVRADQRAYWRLTSLDTLEGSAWSLNQSFESESGELGGVDDPLPGSRTIEQTFTISGLSNVWLPAAYEPQAVDAGDVEVSWDADLGSLAILDDTPRTGLTYSVTSAEPVLDPTVLNAAGTTAPEDFLARFRQLPPDFSPAVREEAQRAVTGATTNYEAARLLQDYFLDGSFTYTLDPPDNPGVDDFEFFLFQAREGFCQQFAGAYTAMARSLGLATRLAVGFTPGEVDPADPTLYRVRGEHAHAWPEVWFPDVGWVAFEPTPGRGAPNSEPYTGVPEQQEAAGEAVGATTVPPATIPDPSADGADAGSDVSVAPPTSIPVPGEGEGSTTPTTTPEDDGILETIADEAPDLFLWGLAGTLQRAAAVAAALGLALLLRRWVRRVLARRGPTSLAWDADGRARARLAATGLLAGAPPVVWVVAAVALWLVVGTVVMVAIVGVAVAWTLVGQDLRARRRRRAATTPNRRTGVAWLEAVEAIDELSAGPRLDETAGEFARRAGTVVAPDALRRLAQLAERAEYSPMGVSAAEADEADALARAIRAAVDDATTWQQRLLARLDPRPPEARGRPEGPRVSISTAPA